MTKRRISIFGATGSIGQSTLDLIGRDPSYQVVAVSGGQNIAVLAALAIRHGAEIALTNDVARLGDLRAALAGSGVAAAAGPDALREAATRPTDIVVSAIVGLAGLAPGLAALGHTKTLALANKESLVAAGPILMARARAAGTLVLPVDSEHSALFQALVGEDIAAVERVIITASGGAFRDWPLERLAGATLAEAQTHPNWSMGQRITIDSASMFNKALEVIEAREYFGFAPDQIEVIVHPESLVHALVGFRDGALMAHLGAPDMRHAIGYALAYPNRIDIPVARLDLAKIARLNFSAPDPVRFPALRMAREVMNRRGYAGACFNGAKEAALDAFIAGRIGFMDMAMLVDEALNALDRAGDLGGVGAVPDDLDQVVRVDAAARQKVESLVASITQDTAFEAF